MPFFHESSLLGVRSISLMVRKIQVHCIGESGDRQTTNLCQAFDTEVMHLTRPHSTYKKVLSHTSQHHGMAVAYPKVFSN